MLIILVSISVTWLTQLNREAEETETDKGKSRFSKLCSYLQQHNCLKMQTYASEIQMDLQHYA